jgi:hypothetical protein
VCVFIQQPIINNSVFHTGKAQEILVQYSSKDPHDNTLWQCETYEDAIDPTQVINVEVLICYRYLQGFAILMESYVATGNF